MTIASLKRRTYEVLEGTRTRDRLSQVVQWFIVILIVVNVAAFVLATIPWLQRRYAPFLLWLVRVSIGTFTVEYLVRVWACTEDERFERPIVGRLRFMLTPAAIIDLLAIVPFYLPRAAGLLDFRVIRALRLFRLLRLLKLGRFSKAIVVFSDVLREKREQIYIAALAVFVLLVLASSLMYVAEHRVQPEAFSSIPAAMWWGTITLTTVGYGDVTPVTFAGRLLGGLIAVLGIGLFALPAGILSSGFQEALERFDEDPEHEQESEPKEEPKGDTTAQEEALSSRAEADRPPARSTLRYCPHCGERLPTPPPGGRAEPEY